MWWRRRSRIVPRPWSFRRSRRDDRGGRSADKAGFTLIECLISFAVLAMLLGVLFRGVVDLRAGAVVVDTRAHADLVARAILEEALGKRDLRNGTTSGLRDGRRWTLEAKSVDLSAQLPRGEDPDPKAQPAGKAPPPAWAPQRLIVRVETGGRPVSVETIRLAKAS